MFAGLRFAIYFLSSRFPSFSLVLEALKAYDAVSHDGTGTEANDNKGETFGQMVVRVAEDTAEKVGDALEKGSAEGGSAGGAAEANDNQGETFGAPIEDSGSLEDAPAVLEEASSGSEANDNQSEEEQINNDREPSLG